MPAMAQGAPSSCGVPTASETRWLAESYAETSTYGRSSVDEWIGSYGALTAVGESLFLYDQSRTRIVHLSGELEERHAFGRQGDGPGEFARPRAIPWVSDASEGHLDFDGRQLVIYDRNDLTFFDTEGEYLWSALLPGFGFNLGRRGVVFVSPVSEDAAVYGADLLGTGPRRLELRTVRRSDRNRSEMLWERAVPTRSREAREAGRAQLHSRQARSYWARHQGCIVVSDGGGGFLWVVNLETLETDSIALPEWDVPDFGDVRFDRSGINIAGRVMGDTNPQPPDLLWRWRGLIVDPDGHAWVRAWTQARDEFEVFVVSLASGEARQLSLPGFPTAFGPPGVFYTVLQTADEEHYIGRLEAERR